MKEIWYVLFGNTVLDFLNNFDLHSWMFLIFSHCLQWCGTMANTLYERLLSRVQTGFSNER